jgi:hypothetical protein
MRSLVFLLEILLIGLTVSAMAGEPKDISVRLKTGDIIRGNSVRIEGEYCLIETSYGKIYAEIGVVDYVSPSWEEARTASAESPSASNSKKGSKILHSAKARKGIKVIKVREGDCLWKISEKYLGDGRRWREILELNPEIKDPDLIFKGRYIRIPVM